MKKKFSLLLSLCFMFVLTVSSCDLNAILNPHTHSYESGHDETSHWQECSCGEKKQVENHSFDEGVLNDTQDKKTYTCTVCGYSYEEECGVPHVHSYAYNHDTEKHWKECSCGLKNSQANHSFTYTITTPATFSSKGTKLGVCVCGYEKDIQYDLTSLEAEALCKEIDDAIDSFNVDTVSSSDLTNLQALESRYNNVPDTYKHFVNKYNDLLFLIAKASGVVESETYQKIESIGLSYKDGAKITEARTAYNKLGASEKKLITNYHVLEAAEKSYAKFKDIDTLFKSSNLETIQKAIINIAVDYYNQGNQIQYDQYTSRRNPGAYAEAGNAYNLTYLDCSSFCNTVFNYLLESTSKTTNICGYSNASSVSTANVNGYAANNSLNHVGKSGYEDIIYYGTVTSTSSSYIAPADRTLATAAEIRALLQPGDVYNYRHGGSDGNNSGHIMLYLGDYKGDGKDYFAHCTGAAGLGTSEATEAGPIGREKENTTTFEASYGAIKIENADIVFKNTTDDRYIFKSDMGRWSIIRPLTRFFKSSSSYKLSDAAIERLVNNGLDIEKDVDIKNYHSITKGNNLTYTVNISNKKAMNKTGMSNINTINDIDYVYVEEKVPENATFVSATNGGIYDETTNTIRWHIDSLEKESTTSVSYTLKATGDISKEILDKDTYANGVRTNMLENYIKTDIDLSKLVNQVNSDITSGSVFTYDYTSYSVVEEYKKVYGVDLKAEGILAYNDNGTYKLGDKTINSYAFSSFQFNAKTNSDCLFKDLVPRMLHGGIKVRAANPDDNNNMRNMSAKFLEPGDIISCKFTKKEDHTENEVYLFLSESCVVKVNSDKKFVKVYNTKDEVEGFVHTLPYYWGFVIVRPSLCSLLQGK